MAKIEYNPPRAVPYTKAQARAMVRSSGFLLLKAQARLNFLKDFGDVYKIPKRLLRRNILIYENIIKACELLADTDYTHFH